MVYITPGLFSHDPAYSHHTSTLPTSTHAPIPNHMVDSQPAPGLGKRKRRAGDDKEGPSAKHISVSSTNHDRFGGSSPTTLTRSSPTSEGRLRLHGLDPTLHEANGHFMFRKPQTECRPVKQMKRQKHVPSLLKKNSHCMDMEIDMPSSPSVQRADPHTNSDIRSCHACGTAPKRKRDLENYLDCQRCDERTCYICARECSACQKAICKNCIVEVGEDGEPWCLECYQKVHA